MDLRQEIEIVKSYNNTIAILSYYNIYLNRDNKSCCPFHDEKTPSFSVDSKGNWKCFGCNKSGDIINFIQDMENISFIEAVKKASEVLHLDIPSKLIQDDDKLGNLINHFKSKPLMINNKEYHFETAHTYKCEDGSPVIIKVKYRAVDSSKTFRIYGLEEQNNKYRYFFGKELKEKKKYIYNYQRVREAIKKGRSIIICEGEKDADNLNNLGFCATTLISKDWCSEYNEQFSGVKNIVFIGDTGEAGENFRKFIWKHFEGKVKSYKDVRLPGIEHLGDNKDVTDWLEVGHTKDELIQAISDTPNKVNSYYWVDTKTVLRNKEEVNIPLATLDNFELILKRTGTSIAFNEITRNMEIKTNFFNNDTPNTIATEIQSYCQKISFPCRDTDVSRWLNVIGYKNRYNPFKSFLDSLKDIWDGESRLQKYFDCFVTVDNFNLDLKHMLFRRWLIHFVASAYDPEFKNYGLLTLKGAQGLGKTSSMEKLIPIKEDWVFLPEQGFVNNKDGIQLITENQLVEFSEFARSAKEVNALKAFVTTPTDRYRKAYDREASNFKRKTVYYATVNDEQFLIDDENRRFWVLDLVDIDLNTLENFNYTQLWAELYHIWHVEKDHKYHLDKEEQALLQTSNINYGFKGEVETQIELSFDFASTKKVWLKLTEIVGFMPKTLSSTVVGRALKKLGVMPTRKVVNGVRERYYLIGLPKEWNPNDIPYKYSTRIEGELKLVVDNTKTFEDVIMSETDKDELISELTKELKETKRKLDISEKMHTKDIARLEGEMEEMRKEYNILLMRLSNK